MCTSWSRWIRTCRWRTSAANRIAWKKRRGELMKLFVDSGSVKEIEQLASIGILDGVTTNPSLLAKEGGDYRQTLKQICQIVKGPVSAEVVATDFQGMLREGRDLASIDEHIVIKVPLTKDGVKACK